MFLMIHSSDGHTEFRCECSIHWWSPTGWSCHCNKQPGLQGRCSWPMGWCGIGRSYGQEWRSRGWHTILWMPTALWSIRSYSQSFSFTCQSHATYIGSNEHLHVFFVESTEGWRNVTNGYKKRFWICKCYVCCNFTRQYGNQPGKVNHQQPSTGRQFPNIHLFTHSPSKNNPGI
jgi:hypothetical protein